MPICDALDGVRAAPSLHDAVSRVVLHIVIARPMNALESQENRVVINNAVAGYRTVRALGESGGDRMILVTNLHPVSKGVATAARSFSQSYGESVPEIRAMKRFSAGTTTAQMLAQVECLTRVQGDHIAAIDDLAASGDDEPLLVLHWAGAGTLRRLLRERPSLRPGEAITIIVPLVGAMSRAHRAGVAIGDVSLDAVRFDESGCPFFTEFSFAQLRTSTPTPAELEHDPAFREDRRQLAWVARSVLSAVRADHDRVRAVGELNDWLSDDTSTGARDWDQQVELRLFALGAPEPLRLAGDTPVGGAPAGGGNEENVAREVAAFGSADVAPPASEARSLLALPPWLDGHVFEAIQYVRRQCSVGASAFIALCRPVRARTWVVAAIGAVCVVAALVVAGSSSSDGREANAQANRSSEVADGGEPEGLEETADLGKTPSDAAQALLVLLEARQRCLRDLSVGCLESVSLVGTPAYVGDAALIEAVLAGGELPKASLLNSVSRVELQQLGDSVLCEFVDADTSKPASVLLMKGEAGWRIRSYTLPE
jgi:hypothetical protein